MFGTATKHLTVVDAHCGGEPARVVLTGLPAIPGATMNEKRLHMMEHLDHFRTLLITEPRGYPCQNVDFVVPATNPDAAFGFIIAEQANIWPLMSGHNIICVATVLLETGLIPMTEPVTKFTLEAPGGLIKIEAECCNGKAIAIKLFNVPAFSHHTDLKVNVPTLGEVTCDVAYGGMHYCIVSAKSVNLQLTPENGARICQYGEMIKTACREQFPVNHPDFHYPGCDILVFRSDETVHDTSTAKNTVVMSTGVLDWDKPTTWTAMLDRSPCGSGTCAVMANMYFKGELKLNEPFVHESIVGSQFVGELIEEVEIARSDGSKMRAVLPTISGRAWITQHCNVVVDPTDPFPAGYTVSDIWA